MFPIDRYTPHGYLDNPAHGWKMGPGGVLRSRPAIGMGWHFPSFAHAYNRKWLYRAFLQIGLLQRGGWLFEAAEFQAAGFQLYSDYHTKNMFSIVFEKPGEMTGRVIFFPAASASPEQDALGCLIQISNRSANQLVGSFSAVVEYERNLEQGLDWTSGVFARQNRGGLTVGAFQEGTTLHFRSSVPPQGNALKAFGLAELREMLRAERDRNQADSLTSLQSPHATCAAANFFNYQLASGGSQTWMLVLARDTSEFPAYQRAAVLMADDAEPLYRVMAAHKASDSLFWNRAPKLGGDFPDYIRRGLVYDFETLRTLVRQPAGIYANPWDAMQLQVPRTVLAEAALDMLIYSYADPETAKAVLYGTFADAPEPNVPCSREDGSYNMVAVDGSPCGTAPEWCFPFQCIDIVYRRTGDRKWLAKLYPYLENFIEFWLRERTDAQGRPFYKCSWEAGQDNSPRFGIKDDPSGGGALTEHLVPADLVAAMTQAGWLLAAWGGELGLPAHRVNRWNTVAERFYALMRDLWRPEANWFHDFDRRSNAFTDVLDTMQLAPFLCRAVTPEQVAAIQEKLADPPKHGQIFHPLMWPSIAFCLIEACYEAGRPDLAAKHSWDALTGVYRWLDSHPPNIDPDNGGVPGVGREYWPQVGNPNANPPRGGGGAEVYGWGCLSAYMLLRYVLGLQEERGSTELVLRPNLPPELMQMGKSYIIRSVNYLDMLLDITYNIGEGGEIEVIVSREQPNIPAVIQKYVVRNGETVKIRF